MITQPPCPAKPRGPRPPSGDALPGARGGGDAAGIVPLSDGVEGIAEPFSREDYALLPSVFPETTARIFVCGRASSSFDLAWHLHGQTPLPDWGAALALSQTAGRGQLRRSWFSPPGNLHVSFRLPREAIFAGPAASVLVALLLLEAFAGMGLPLRLKWPNDLALSRNGLDGKLGGILLEERHGEVIAGLGVNCLHLPEAALPREGASLPPARLPEGFAWRSPLPLWIELVRNIKILYEHSFRNFPPEIPLRRAEKQLLWRGREVWMQEADNAARRGRIIGLSDQGGLLLRLREADGRRTVREFASGGLTVRRGLTY